MPTKEIEEALEPKRIIKIFISVFLIAVLCIALVAGIHMANNAAKTVEATSRDHIWFTQTLEQIRSLDHQIKETKTALDTHKKSVDSRLISKIWVSSDDRAQTQRLTQRLLNLQQQYETLIRDYNTSAEIVNPDVLGNLPKKVTIDEH